jgi:dTDP-4-amino-4,6-dideoxygalactose transaminase
MEIPFSKVPMAGNETRYLNEVLASGWLTTSSKAMSFEQKFKEFIGVKYACAVNSCTSALHLAVEALNIAKGDKVLVPSLTFTATAEVLRYVGADPVFMDVEYGANLITPTILKKALIVHRNIKGIIIVHYGGQAPELTNDSHSGIIDICKENNILIIEDAAHAFPTKFRNSYIGTFGDVTCFSFYANKTITTGEGGMLVTNRDDVYNRVKTMRLHGINRDIWSRFTDKKASWEYDVIAPGFKYNMPDINAAIGLAQLEKASLFRYERQRCAEFYYQELKDNPYIDLPVYIGEMGDHAWHLFSIVIKPNSPVNRNDLIQMMAKEGIGTSVHYKPLHQMTYYKETYNLRPEDYPNTEKIWHGNISLPIYPQLTTLELRYICNTLNKILKSK